MKWRVSKRISRAPALPEKWTLLSGTDANRDLVSPVLESGPSCHRTTVPPEAWGQDVSQAPSFLGARGIFLCVFRPSSVPCSASPWTRTPVLPGPGPPP